MNIDPSDPHHSSHRSVLGSGGSEPHVSAPRNGATVEVTSLLNGAGGPEGAPPADPHSL